MFDTIQQPSDQVKPLTNNSFLNLIDSVSFEKNGNITNCNLLLEESQSSQFDDSLKEPLQQWNQKAEDLPSMMSPQESHISSPTNQTVIPQPDYHSYLKQL